MPRLVAPLAVAGVALLGVALWLYNSAAADKSAADAICRFAGAQCNTGISWPPIAAVVASAVLAFFAAWRASKTTN